MKKNIFKLIDKKFRPVPLWSWNDLLFEDELRHQIKEMAQKGWGGFFMHPRVGILTRINSPEWFEKINACVQIAAEEGIDAWLYDEDRWPSGFGAGEVTQTEEYRQRVLALVDDNELLPTDTVFCDLTDNGIEYHIVKRISPTGDSWFNGMCYADLMNPNAVAKFLECMHERLRLHCGKDFGSKIPGIFTDEPNYIMHNDFKMPALPWSEYLPPHFKARHGYDITEHVASLFFPIGDYHKIRFDFYDSASSLLLQSFTKQYYDWCEKNGLKLVGHFMAEDWLDYQTEWVGNVMPHYEYMHYPGIDKLGRHIDRNITVKQVASVAEQLGKERTLSEVYGCIGQQCGFRERKWIADWQAVLGINLVVPHLSLYSMRGERKRDFPANLNYQQPWWEDERPFADYISRLSQCSAFGKSNARLLVIHTISSSWAAYSPVDSRNGHKTVYDPLFAQICERLLCENIDFHYGDETLMQKYGSIRNGKLVIGKCEYDAVLVPPSLTLRSSTAELLQEFAAKNPGRLVYIRPFPERIDGRKAEISFSDAVKYNSIQDALEYLKKLYGNRVLTTDRLTKTNAERILCCTKSDGEIKLVLFANTEKRREIRAVLSVCDSRAPYLLDLADGAIHQIEYKRNNERISVDVTLYAAGSLALIFADKITDVKEPLLYTSTGAAFGSCSVHGRKCDITSVRTLSENVLPINNATLYTNGKLTAADVPVASLWKDGFYALKDGTPFAAEYKFTVGYIPKGELFAAIESAQNLDLITLNGVPLTPMRSFGEAEVFDSAVNYIDTSFVKTPLKNIKEGENVLRIEGKKVNNTNGAGGHNLVDGFNDYHCTELEAVYIIGDFIAESFDNTDFRITARLSEPSAKNITDDGYPFYAGKLQVEANTELHITGSRVYMRLCDAACCDVAVHINGAKLDQRYMKPYIFDVTDYVREGENHIALCLAGTLYNLLGPNWRDDIPETKYVSPRTFDDMSRYTEEYHFIPFGIGGIEIIQT